MCTRWSGTEISIKWGWGWAKETYYTVNSWLTNSWVTQPLSKSSKLWLEAAKLNDIISHSISLLQQITNSVSSSVLPFSNTCSQRNQNHLKAWIQSSQVMSLLKTCQWLLTALRSNEILYHGLQFMPVGPSLPLYPVLKFFFFFTPSLQLYNLPFSSLMRPSSLLTETCLPLSLPSSFFIF